MKRFFFLLVLAFILGMGHSFAHNSSITVASKKTAHVGLAVNAFNGLPKHTSSRFNPDNFSASVFISTQGNVSVSGALIHTFTPTSFATTYSEISREIDVTFTVPPGFSNSGEQFVRTYTRIQPPVYYTPYNQANFVASVAINTNGAVQVSGANVEAYSPLEFTTVETASPRNVQVQFKIPSGYSDSGQTVIKNYTVTQPPRETNGSRVCTYKVINEGGPHTPSSFSYTQPDGRRVSYSFENEDSSPVSSIYEFQAIEGSVDIPINTALTVWSSQCQDAEEAPLFSCLAAAERISASIDQMGYVRVNGDELSLVATNYERMDWVDTPTQRLITVNYIIPQGYQGAGDPAECNIEIEQPISHPLMTIGDLPRPIVPLDGTTTFATAKSPYINAIVIDKEHRYFSRVCEATQRTINLSIVVPELHYNQGETLQWTAYPTQPAVEWVTYYRDQDNDSLGDPANSRAFCPLTGPTSGWVENNTDQCPEQLGPVSNYGCPEVEEEYCSGTKTGVYIPASPSSNHNYVMTKVYQDPNGENALSNIQYYDGLGRPSQAVAVGAAPSGADLVSQQTYDAFGRANKAYLPTPLSGTAGSYRTALSTQAVGHYNVDNPYSETVYEASPLNRVSAQKAPGSFADTPVEQSYDTNTANEVNRYSVDEEGNITASSYAAGSLFKNGLEDENRHTTYTYTDLQGRVVLKRAPSTGEGYHDTYYLYDAYGNLRYVLPPAAQGKTDQATLDQLGYQYHYDRRNRLISKQLPGKGVEYMVYDEQDRLLLTQDAIMRDDNKALKTIYDAHGRVIETGFITNAGNSQQALGNSAGNEINEGLTQQFYDAYPSGAMGSIELPEQAETGVKLQGLPTISKTKVLGTSHWVTSVTGYDHRGRVIFTATHNPALDVLETQTHALDFVGRITQTTTTHSREPRHPNTGEDTTLTWIDRFTYDTNGRVVTHKRTLDNKTETLAAHCYNDLGQLERKTLGGALQTLDYSYNIRGWLTATNDPEELEDDLFAFTLGYNSDKHNGEALYNGNIAYTEWKSVNDDQLNWYVYDYDALNRIKAATHSSGNYDVTGIRYDLNGNIEHLNRQGFSDGNYTTLDQLSYTYNGNQLLAVQDAAMAQKSFKDGASQPTEYTYDANGNMLSDANKGITTTTTQVSETKVVETLIPSSKQNQLPEVMPDPFVSGWDYLPGGPFYDPNQDPEAMFWSFNSQDFIASSYALYDFYEDVIYGRYDVWTGTYTQGSDPFDGLAYYFNPDLRSVYVDYASEWNWDWTYDEFLGTFPDPSDPLTKGYDPYTDSFYGYDFFNPYESFMSYTAYDDPFMGGFDDPFFSDPFFDDPFFDDPFFADTTMNDPFDPLGLGADTSAVADNAYLVDTNLNWEHSETYYTYWTLSNLEATKTQVAALRQPPPPTVKKETVVTYKTVTNNQPMTVTYNHLNLPTQIVVKGNTIGYQYMADGTKLKKTASGNTTLYTGATVYKDGTLELIHTPEGYIEPTDAGYKYIYRISDHLGNTRVSFTKNETTNEIDVLQTNDYYPFGLTFDKPVQQASSSNIGERFKFNGKERDPDLGWDDFGARMYDPALGRWMNIDPLAELMRRHSPFNYAFDNPIYFIDPDGRAPFPGIQIAGLGLALNRIKKTVQNISNGDNVVVAYAKAVADDPIVTGLADELPGVGEAIDLAKGDYAATALGAVPGGKKIKKAVDAIKAKNLQQAVKKGIPKSQLGPSGKPKIHTVSKANNKKAKDAARNNSKSNSKPVKHSSDKGQKTHYHSTKDGKKMSGKDNVHYEDRSSKKN